jgi:four helix bundle protein
MVLETQLTLLKELGFVKENDLGTIENNIEEESKMLNALINKINNKEKGTSH